MFLAPWATTGGVEGPRRVVLLSAYLHVRPACLHTASGLLFAHPQPLASHSVHNAPQREEEEARSTPDSKPWPALLCVRGDEEHLPLAPKSVDREWGAALGRVHVCSWCACGYLGDRTPVRTLHFRLREACTCRCCRLDLSLLPFCRPQ